jgi:hypoxanthine phosphoribosyltransferase
MKEDIKKILIDQSEIDNKIRLLADKISHDYAGKNPVVICILKGAVIFLSDLLKKISIPLQIDFMAVSSYGDSTVSSGVVNIRKDIDCDIADRHVIIVEDIVDSGLTLKYIVDYLKKHNCASLKICALLDKPDAHQTELKIDYLGFSVGNDFVVGYGLDFAQRYRNLPFIGILKEEIYKGEK